MYDAVDEDLKVEVEGRSPFPQSAHRVSVDGFVLNVPILVFVWNLVVACKRLYSKNPVKERVVITSTDYFLEFERQDNRAFVEVQQRENNRFRSLGRTEVPLQDLILECKSVAEMTLLNVTAENPEIKADMHLQRIAASIEELKEEVLYSSRSEKKETT